MNQQLALPTRTTVTFRAGREFGKEVPSVHTYFSTSIRTATLHPGIFPTVRILETRITDVISIDLLTRMKMTTRMITTIVGTVKLTYFGAIVDLSSKTEFGPTKIEFPRL